MDFAALKTELYARGFTYLSEDAAGVTRAGRWLNSAYQELCEQERWPFLMATATGAAPLTVSDLGAVESVRDTDRSSVELAHADRRNLVGAYGDLTTTGTPTHYYITGGTVVNTYPVGGTLSVLYYKVPAELTGTDTPVVPTRFQELIVDGAVKRAYSDSDNFDAAAAVKQEWINGVDAMRMSLLWQYDGHDLVREVAGSGDW